MLSGKRRTWALAPVVLLLLVLLGVVYTFSGLSSASHRIRRTDEVELTLSRLVRSLVDAETGQRGYLASGDRQFLDVYERGRSQWPAELARAARLTADDPRQQERLARVQGLATRKMGEMTATLAAYEEGARGAELSAHMLRGKDLMDEIRAIVGEVQRDEEALALADEQARGAHARWTAVLFVSAVLVFAAVVAVAWIQRQKAERVAALQGEVLAERAALERERTEAVAARKAAEDATRVKDEFLAMLGHELRNPLAPITTAVHLLKLRRVEARELTVIERQAHHLTRLVDDLLDVSRISRGKVALSREPVEIADVVATAIEMATPVVDRGQHTLVTEVAGAGLGVNVDPMRMAQVLANLLTNAAKYTPPGGRIRLHAAREGAGVAVHVEDTGEGISAELLPHVFDSFVQSRQTLARSRGGLGLGLAIVKSLVALHDGTVSVHSDGPGLGSTFTVRLPAVDVPPKARAQSVGARVDEHRSARVLVVDDNVDAAEMMAEALEVLGYEAIVAHDGAQALTLADDRAPQVALLDIGLPVMDGYELAARLRERHHDLTLFAITGYGQESDRQRSRAAGFREHVTKPVDMERLHELLEQSMRLA